LEAPVALVSTYVDPYSGRGNGRSEPGVFDTASRADFPMATYAVFKDALKAAKKAENEIISRPTKP
jgi:hypothetical protein